MRNVVVIVVLLGLATTPAWAQTQMPSAVVSGGGTDMSGTHMIRGTVAQSAIGGPLVGMSYRLEIGFWHGYRDLVSATPDAPAYIWDLKKAYPNPFNPQTTIAYSLPEDSRVSMRVYDMRGSVVATLVDGPVAAGDHVAVWDGRSDSGIGAASGVYFVRIDSRHGGLTRKMVLIK